MRIWCNYRFYSFLEVEDLLSKTQTIVCVGKGEDEHPHHFTFMIFDQNFTATILEITFALKVSNRQYLVGTAGSS